MTGRAEGNVAADPPPDPQPAETWLAGGDDADPWFAPGPKAPVLAEPETSDDGGAGNGALGDGALTEGAADPGSDTAQWFLRTGRAGLLPDAMTVSWDEAGPDGGDQLAAARPLTAGAPPWAGEEGGTAGSVPPPWETGPWPGPGETRAARPGTGRPGTGRPGTGRQNEPLDESHEAWPDGLPARVVLAAAIVPLVVPGLVAGILGLRRARSAGTSQLASWAAIALSAVWALVIVLVFAGGSGGQAGACASYPASVRAAYTRAVTDLASPVVSQAQAADIRNAASAVNAAAAAAAGQTAVRTRLAEMANDIGQAGSYVTAHRQVPAALLQALAADGTALAAACPGH